MSIRAVALLVASVACSAEALAQDLAWLHTPPVDIYRVDSGLTARIGDTNGDGYVDVIWQGTARIIGGKPLTTILVTSSGKDGRILRYSVVPDFYSVWALAGLGDINGDGNEDYGVTFRVGNTGNDRVQARSGIDGQLIWSVDRSTSISFGASIAGRLDVDGDGRLDVVVTAPRLGPYGAVVVIDHSGRVKRQIGGTLSLLIGERSGHSIGVVGDVNGDGGDDFVVCGYDRTGTYGRGCGVVISGKTGQILTIGYDERPGDLIGDAVAGIGDIDGDGVPDFAAGGWTRSSTRPAAIRAFSGRDGTPLFSWRGDQFAGPFSGDDLVGGHDIDRDGIPDIVQSNYGALRAFSGRDGKLLISVQHRGGIGRTTTVIPSTPSSPFPLLVSGEPEYGYSRYLQYIGRVHAYRAVPPTTRLIGRPCAVRPTSGPGMPKIGCRNLYNRDHSRVVGTRITMFDAEPALPAVLILGQSDRHHLGRLLPWSLGDLGLPRCALHISSEIALPVTTGNTGIDIGYAAIDLPSPASTNGTLGLFAQWLVLDRRAPRLQAVSDALSLRISP